MNNRIQELVNQVLPNEREFNKGNPEDWGYFFSGDELEKFAQLIVQECANIARTKSDTLIEKGLKYAEDQDEEISVKATAWQLLVLAQEIKQHFGVK